MKPVLMMSKMRRKRKKKTRSRNLTSLKRQLQKKRKMWLVQEETLGLRKNFLKM